MKVSDGCNYKLEKVIFMTNYVKVEVERFLWQMVGELSGEFHVNKPLK